MLCVDPCRLYRGVSSRSVAVACLEGLLWAFILVSSRQLVSATSHAHVAHVFSHQPEGYSRVTHLAPSWVMQGLCCPSAGFVACVICVVHVHQVHYYKAVE